MNRNILKKYAPQARRDFIQAVTDRASYYGLTKKKTEPVAVEGDVAVIMGRAFPKKVAEQRRQLEQRVARQGFDQVMEAMAYTWFNRMVAIRFMELHGYLEHGYRVLSHPGGSNTPEILDHADSVDLPGLDPQQVIDLKLAGNKDAELYRMLLIAQCNALHKAMPFLFEKIDDETELLLPDNLLHSDSLIRTLVNEIPEEDWQEVEIIGWLYQFYISEKKDQVIGKVVKSEDIPAATQLFTPNWIVKYLVQNSLGRQWVATYPNSSLNKEMEYYIEPADQTPEVQEQLKAITPDKIDPEELTLLDPACGSGHILVEAYDLLKAIYLERGYPKKDIPRLILEKNLYGLEIDDRAAQLASLALMMKARADDRRIFSQSVQPHVLSIQESKGLDAKEITEALNAPILMTEVPPSGELFEEIADEKSPLFSKKNLSVKGDIAQADIARLIDLFEHGKTCGSLIQVPEGLVEKLPAIAKRVEDVIAHGGMFEKVMAHAIYPLVSQARLLERSYDAVVMNPPYIGIKGMNPLVKDFLEQHYPDERADIGVAFIHRSTRFTRQSGSFALVTMHSWMFLSGYSVFRDRLLSCNRLTSMAHLGARAFSSISGEVVQVTAFSGSVRPLEDYRPTFIRLTEGDEADKRRGLQLKSPAYSGGTQKDFASVPGHPLAYWATTNTLKCFQRFPLLESFAAARSGMTTANNNVFLRLWHEVSQSDVMINCKTEDECVSSGKKWFPYNKGGPYRKWFGNNSFVVNWMDAGRDILATGRAYPRSRSLYFQSGATWTDVTSSGFAVRFFDEGFLFDASGPSVFCEEIRPVVAFLCSCVANHLLTFLNPTHHCQPGDVGSLPVATQSNALLCQEASTIADTAIALSKVDWDLSETSWDFCKCPFIAGGITVEDSLNSFHLECVERTKRVRELEERNNQLFVDAYGLSGEVPANVSDEQVTLYRPDREEDIQRLISFAIGCMMGRYSLDKPGLIYAHSGNEGFDPSHYKTFSTDEDGIIPITEFEWFEDDAANRVEQFIATAWPEDNLEENLKFVAESIGQKKSESARDAIRRYLCTGFYKHHLSLYKKRPIYWLFSSGKQRALQCLVYLHRYNSGTLARMRTEYVIPLSGKIDARIEQLAGDIAAASSTSHQKKLTKERDTLIKHQEELQKFDEKLKHYADQRIELDLDDGVKVNYGKFGDLLAEVKAVTGQKAE